MSTADVVLITGASGFLGRAVAARLRDEGRAVRSAVHRRTGNHCGLSGEVFLSELDSTFDWRPGLRGVRDVVHCAARVHVLKEAAADPLADFRRVNTAGTARLARQAADVGVRRFVFISSIGVNGAETFDRPFTNDSEVAPHSPYAVSKHEAELELQRVARESGMKFVILRPPLIYGPGAPGNFEQLIRLLNSRLPLPLGAIRNRRSFVALDNIVDLIVTCLDREEAADRTLLVSDDEDVSTTDLLRRLGQALGKPARLISVPARLLSISAAAIGRHDMAQRLCGSLQVDISATRRALAWTPPIGLAEGLRRAVHSQ